MINTDSHYRTTYAYNNNGIDMLSHYSDAFSPNAHITRIQVHATQSTLMCYHATLTSECLITHITGICTLTTCMFILYQVILLDECIITHIRGIWKLTTYCVGVLPAYSDA